MPSPFSPEQEVRLKALQGALQEWVETLLLIQEKQHGFRMLAIENALIERGLVTSEALNAALQEIQVTHRVDATLDQELQAAWDALERIWPKERDDPKKEQ